MSKNGKKTKKYTVIFILGAMLLACMISSCATGPVGEPIYTAYNMWFDDPDDMWCINFKKGKRIQAGTQVWDIEVDDEAISFTTDRGDFTVNFNRRWHPGRSIHDYNEMMFSVRDLGALTQGMSESEIKAIKTGRVIKGMSKDAVMVSFGPPAEHRTPTLEGNSWVYWTTRHNKRAVRFDKNGKTLSGF